MSSEDEEESPEEGLDSIPYDDALHAVNTLIKWSSSDSAQANKHTSNLLKLRADIVTKHFTKTQKQSTLDTFFSKN